MNYCNLGPSGLRVSPLCLGCMSFGTPDAGRHKWSVDENTSERVIAKALNVGINFFDTANVYSYGASEQILGNIVRRIGGREDMVIATKVGLPMRGSPHGGGLSRKTILFELEQSLRRLGTDYVDLYIVHRPDPLTPVEETLETLDSVVRAGKVRYIGASTMMAWQFSEMLTIQESRGWARFISMQNHYNLLVRDEEQEMIPLCREKGIGITPWSPLARGRLCTPNFDTSAHKRAKTDEFGRMLYGAEGDQSRQDRIIMAVDALARERGVSMTEIALAWLMQQPAISAPVFGTTRLEQIDAAVSAVSIKMTSEEIEFLNS